MDDYLNTLDALNKDGDLTVEQVLELNNIIGNTELEYGKGSFTEAEIENLKKVVKGEITPEEANYQLCLNMGISEEVAKKAIYGK